MTSEAAQKAFPDDELHTEEEVSLKILERMAFDRGAAEALRQAAERSFYMLDPEEHNHMAAVPESELRRMADEWEAGQ